MKGSSAMFWFMTLCVALITCMNVKRNFGHVWFLGPHTLGKSIFPITCVDIKQNLNHVWFLGPHTLGKLILPVISLSIKQSLGHAWLLGPHASSKPILPIIFPSVKQNLGNVGSLGPHVLGKLTLVIIQAYCGMGARWNSKYGGLLGLYTLDRHELHYHLRLRRKSKSALHPLGYLPKVHKVFFF